jgi:hypothetical protein
MVSVRGRIRLETFGTDCGHMGYRLGRLVLMRTVDSRPVRRPVRRCVASVCENFTDGQPIRQTTFRGFAVSRYAVTTSGFPFSSPDT